MTVLFFQQHQLIFAGEHSIPKELRIDPRKPSPFAPKSQRSGRKTARPWCHAGSTLPRPALLRWLSRNPCDMIGPLSRPLSAVVRSVCPTGQKVQNIPGAEHQFFHNSWRDLALLLVSVEASSHHLRLLSFLAPSQRVNDRRGADHSVDDDPTLTCQDAARHC